MEKITKTLLESLNSEPTKEIKIVKESEENVHKVKELAADFARSQGFYGRLLRDMTEYEASVGGAENIEYPIYM